jgi:hypothetical protein
MHNRLHTSPTLKRHKFDFEPRLSLYSFCSNKTLIDVADLTIYVHSYVCKSDTNFQAVLAKHKSLKIHNSIKG